MGYKPLSKRKESLLTCLADLFGNIASQKKKVGVLAPKKFVARLRKENGEEKFNFYDSVYVVHVGTARSCLNQTNSLISYF